MANLVALNAPGNGLFVFDQLLAINADMGWTHFLVGYFLGSLEAGCVVELVASIDLAPGTLIYNGLGANGAGFRTAEQTELTHELKARNRFLPEDRLGVFEKSRVLVIDFENVFGRHVVVDTLLVERTPTVFHAAVDLAFLAFNDGMAQVALGSGLGQNYFVSVFDKVECVLKLSLGLLLFLG